MGTFGSKGTLTIVMAVLAIGVPTVMGAPIYQEQFDGAAGTDPPTWTDVQNDWTIDKSADADGEYRFEQDGSATGVAFVNQPTGTGDYTVTIKFRLGGNYAVAGVLGRVQDSNSFYHLRVSIIGDDALELYKFDGGATLLTQALLPEGVPLDGSTHYLRLSFDGTRITGAFASDADFNHVLASVSATDDTFSNGGVGLRASNGSNKSQIVAVDTLTVTPLPEPGSLTLIGLGGLTLLGRKRRRSSSQ